MLRAFREEAADARVASVESREVEGDPLLRIEVEATAHDLVVVGARSLFDVDGELHGMPVCVERIVRGEPRPVLLVPQY